MGEIAEMMLDGTLCEGCGVYMEGEGQGFPRYCSPQCARDRGAEYYVGGLGFRSGGGKRGRKRGRGGPSKTVSPKARFPCAVCGKRFRSERGVADHTRDAHGSDGAARS